MAYGHVGRGLYYGSFKEPRTATWFVGVILLVMIIGTAFLGFLHSQTWCLVYNVDISLKIAIFPFVTSERCAQILAKHNINPFAVFFF